MGRVLIKNGYVITVDPQRRVHPDGFVLINGNKIEAVGNSAQMPARDVARTIDAIKQLKDHYQLTVLMAEQNFTQAIRIADRGYVIVHGKIAFEGRSADELNNNDLIRQFYLGM